VSAEEAFKGSFTRVSQEMAPHCEIVAKLSVADVAKLSVADVANYSPTGLAGETFISLQE
jgi:hypothetical protein